VPVVVKLGNVTPDAIDNFPELEIILVQAGSALGLGVIAHRQSVARELWPIAAASGLATARLFYAIMPPPP